jgi:pentose-5-phosphate-3-epimerase
MHRESFLDELREAAPLLSVGILTADLMSLGSELGLIQEAGVRMGTDIIVTGSAVFDGKTPGEDAAFMMDAIRKEA